MTANSWDPFAWLGDLLDDLFGAEDPHADDRATHGAAEVRTDCQFGPCCGPSHGHDDAAGR